MIVYIEVPCSGERAFAEILRTAHGDDCGRLYPLPPHDPVLPDLQMDGLSLYFNGLKSFCSPVVRRTPSVEAQWPGARFVSFLCHPITRLLHDYTSFFHRFSVPRDPIPAHCLPALASVTEFARRPAGVNVLTRHFSNADAWEEIGPAHLERALDALRRLDYLGIGEYFDHSLRPLFRDYPELEPAYEKIRAGLGPLSCPAFGTDALSADELAALENLNALDLQLYDAACRRVLGRPSGRWPARVPATEETAMLPRFIDHADGTITDGATGLMWRADGGTPDLPDMPGGRKPWSGPFAAHPAGLPEVRTGCYGPRPDVDLNGSPPGYPAFDYIDALNASAFAGYTDWRLPNVNELASLIDETVPHGHLRLIESGFLNIEPHVNYWSSTTCHNHPEQAWHVHFTTNGNVHTSCKAWCAHHVLPVRGANSGPRRLLRTGQALSYSPDPIPAVLTGASGRGQDGDLQLGLPWPGDRFEVRIVGGSAAAPNRVVIDHFLGLAWAAEPLNVAMPWDVAMEAVPRAYAGYGGLDGWRLPGREELRSLVHYGNGNLLRWLEEFGFRDVRNADYWTGAPYAADPDRYVWSFGLAWGLYCRDRREFRALAWPVCPFPTPV